MYYPILRWKQGEIRALEYSPEEWKQQITPIWIIEEFTQIENAISQILSVWSSEQILDLSRRGIDTIDSKAWKAIIDNNILFAIAPSEVENLSAEQLKVFNQNPIIRLTFDDPSSALYSNLSKQVLSLIDHYSVNSNTQLILDFGTVIEEHEICASDIATTLRTINGRVTRPIIISGGCFPTTLQEVTSRAEIRRIDKSFYNLLCDSVDFPLMYSDYCTLNPEWDQAGIMRTSHSAIRYTHDDHWLVLRVRGRDSKALFGLTKLLVLEDDYRGREFSWADNVWFLRASEPPETGSGNSLFHVSEFIHHHIAQVLAYG